jgi:CRISPR-associated protein Csb2
MSSNAEFDQTCPVLFGGASALPWGPGLPNLPRSTRDDALATRSLTRPQDRAFHVRHFCAFALRRAPNQLSSRRTLRSERAAVVAAMLRHAACRAAESDRDYWIRFPGGSNIYVAGHTRDDPTLRRGPTPPRFSYLPLPSIASPRADGIIRRVLIAEPFDGDGRCARWAGACLSGADLVDERTGRAVARLARLDSGDHVLRLFTQRSRRWVSATPLILPGFDGLNACKAEKLFLRACEQSGLPARWVEDIQFISPPLYCGEFVRFFVPRYLRPWPVRWVMVQFTREISGPLTLGAGRHCGLGLLAVQQEMRG